MKGVYDPRLIRREFYNPNDFDILVELDPKSVEYVRSSGIATGPGKQWLKAKSWLLVNHNYLILTAKNGAPLFDLIEIFGNRIGKGEKLPSLPIFDKTWVRET